MSASNNSNFLPPDSWSQAIESIWPVQRWCNVNVIVAVSGGPDSVALIRTLAELRQRQLTNTQPGEREETSGSAQSGTLILTHINHGLRGPASAADQDFVQQLARELQLPCETYSQSGSDANPSPDASGTRSPASEADLRKYRYECLQAAAAKHMARYIVTGHTLDDQIETILFRIFRGTGLRGLTGIPAVRRLSNAITLVRPLLTIEKREILQTLMDAGLDFRQDASNQQSKYTRNFLRNELLPLVRSRFPDADQAIARLGQHASDLKPMFMANREKLQTAIDIRSSDELTIDCQQLQTQVIPTICELLIATWDQAEWPRGEINQATWQTLARMIVGLDTNQNVINLPGNVRAQRSGNRLTLSRQGKS